MVHLQEDGCVYAVMVWYSVFYMHQYKQSCRQNSGEGSKHVEDIKIKN